MTPIRFSIAGALGAKALLGGAVVALAAGAAGTVTTHSVNPETWGQHVVQVVESCKAGDGNVGRCVSAAARLHGEQVRAQHSEAVENATASPSPKPGERDGQDTGASSRGGSAASDGHGQSQDHEASPAPSTAAHGHARPSPEPSAHE